MGDHEVRYFVIPMIVVFILGIAAISGLVSPVTGFLIVGLIAILTGTVCGWLVIGIKWCVSFFHNWKEHRTVKKVITVPKR
ncbi:hypothetical protein HCJ66_04935 [Listeria sp. FSL L7-1582]|uniref:hypothetical protein n=1 Tax=Listeria portnoyi TaxID=2713504 RepID=UPI00164E6002|nr:hypothetical protein [Listeria portnoyi]MBC6308899.1 hypothetical protein [Listeria portnoyi]